MTRVFISYRREDSAETCGRIYDRLEGSLGRHNVFKDVDNIPPGVDFRSYLQDALRMCDVALIVIGPRWLASETATGERRLFVPSDFVRLEIEVALQLNKPVIPVLVNNAQPPAETDLPPSIARLAYLNAVNVRPDPDFRRDMDHVIGSLSGYGQPAPQYVTPGAPQAQLRPQMYHSSQPAAPAGYYPQGYALAAPAAPKLSPTAQLGVRVLIGAFGIAAAVVFAAALVIQTETGHTSTFTLNTLPAISIGLDVIGSLIAIGVVVAVRRADWITYLVVMHLLPIGLAPLVYAIFGPTDGPARRW